jgi:outer membrane protein assembly factor BamB
VAWKVDLPGTGAGSPIVVNDRVYLNYAEQYGKQRSLLCIDAQTGQPRWKRTVQVAKEELTHKDNPYCGSTPVSDGYLVVTWHGTGGLHAYTLDGDTVWSKDFGVIEHLWGYGNSPIIDRERVILHSGVGKRMFVAAFRLTDGEQLWMTEEPGGQTNATPDSKWVGSWATPIVLREQGRSQAICAMPTSVVALDCDTGTEVWRCDGLSGENSDLMYTSPLASNEFVVVMAGYKGPALAVRRGGTGNVTDSHRQWLVAHKNPQRIGSGVIVDQHLYIANADAGTLQCLETESGEECWHKRIAGGPHWASTILAGGLLYMTNRSGITRVVRPAPEGYQLVAENEIGQPVDATPAFSQNRIFIRSTQQLWCISTGSTQSGCTAP